MVLRCWSVLVVGFSLGLLLQTQGLEREVPQDVILIYGRTCEKDSTLKSNYYQANTVVIDLKGFNMYPTLVRLNGTVPFRTAYVLDGTFTSDILCPIAHSVEKFIANGRTVICHQTDFVMSPQKVETKHQESNLTTSHQEVDDEMCKIILDDLCKTYWVMMCNSHENCCMQYIDRNTCHFPGIGWSCFYKLSHVYKNIFRFANRSNKISG